MKKAEPTTRTHDEVIDSFTRRVLVHVRGGAQAKDLLRALETRGFGGVECADLAELCREIKEGAGAVLMGDTVVDEPSLDFLAGCLGKQPPWSDLPLVILSEGGESLMRALAAFTEAGVGGNITVIHPDQEINLVNALRVAIRSRLRQYEVRKLIEQNEALLKSIRDSFLLLDRDWRFTYVNEKAAEMRGCRPEDLIGKRKWDVFPELADTPYYTALQKVMEEGKSRHIEHFDPITRRWYEKRVYPSEAGVSIIGTDITERREAEEALRESEQRLRLMIESAREYAIFSMDLEGRITSWNSGAERLLGYGEEEVVGEHMEIIFTEQDRQKGHAQAELREALQTDRAEDERWHVRKDGTRFWAGGQVARMLDEAGQVRGFVKILRDYTGRKRAEVWLRSLNETLEKRVAERTAEAEQRAAQLRMLASELTDAEQRERRRLAEVLHDHLQQILVAAKMQVGMLAQRPGDAVMGEGLERVDNLLKRSIDASRSLTVELSPPILYDAGLAAALHWLSRSMAENHNLRVTVIAQPEAEPESDNIRALLFQSVRELLFNVVKHARATTAEVSLIKCDSEVEVLVSDEGAGFDPALITHQEHGGGFGLFSIRERVELLGGSLKIETGSGTGTKVSVKVPIRQEDRETVLKVREEQVRAIIERRESPAEETVPAAAGRIRILLADDHKILREGLAGLLREQPDFEVVSEASDGQMAVDMARETRPDVIVMDVSMPRLNGVEATRTIKSERPEVVVIGLSMHAKEDMADAMRSAGAVAYVTKGAPSEILTATIRDAVAQKAD